MPWYAGGTPQGSLAPRAPPSQLFCFWRCLLSAERAAFPAQGSRRNSELRRSPPPLAPLHVLKLLPRAPPEQARPHWAEGTSTGTSNSSRGSTSNRASTSPSTGTNASTGRAETRAKACKGPYASTSACTVRIPRVPPLLPPDPDPDPDPLPDFLRERFAPKADCAAGYAPLCAGGIPSGADASASGVRTGAGTAAVALRVRHRGAQGLPAPPLPWRWRAVARLSASVAAPPRQLALPVCALPQGLLPCHSC